MLNKLYLCPDKLEVKSVDTRRTGTSLVIYVHERVVHLQKLLSLISSLDECLPCGRPDIRPRKTAHHIADRQNPQLTLGLRLPPPPPPKGPNKQSYLRLRVCNEESQQNLNVVNRAGNPEPDPQDLHVFGPSGSGSISQRYGSGSGSRSGSFLFLIKLLSGPKIMLAKKNFNAKFSLKF
jgi:hypothetical protein